MTAERGRDYKRWRRLLADEQLPAAFVDMDAVDANIATLCSALGGSPATIRVATKSVRSVWLLRYILNHGGPQFRGLMTYSAAEAALLAEEGLNDFLMGYPIAQRHDARLLAKLVGDGVVLTATIDAPAHVDLLDWAAKEAGVTLPVCIDVDMSWRPLGGRIHLGVRRSPVRNADDINALAGRVRRASHLKLTAVLAYEAQVAGISDRNPTSRHLDPVRRAIKARSRPVVAERRRRIVDALKGEGHELELVNGGGTGSIAWTSCDDSVTEVTAGSGFLCSHLFDHYEGLSLRPGAFFALPVVRASDPGIVTCASGGFIASGPPAWDRAPVVFLPDGLSPLSMEGWGEVQTPFKVRPGATMPDIGDPVICRHAKAGELAEHFNDLAIIRNGAIERRVLTYRGVGFSQGSRRGRENT